jgi:hypothetical protein
MDRDDSRRRRALQADLLEMILFGPETACLLLDAFADDPPSQRPTEQEVFEALQALEEEGLAHPFVEDASGWSDAMRKGSGVPEAARGDAQIVWWEAVSLRLDGARATTD